MTYFVRQADHYTDRGSDPAGDEAALQQVVPFITALPTAKERRDTIEWYETVDSARYASLRDRVAKHWNKTQRRAA